MANYKETSLSGTEHTRCCLITIANSFQVTPIISFTEQKVTILSDGKIISEKGDTITIEFNPSKIIPEFDPTTGQQTGNTLAYSDLHKDIYSAYMAAALERDANAG